MQRLPSKPRSGWEQIVEQSGLMHWQGKWNESAKYVFTPTEIEEIEIATRELHLLAMQAVQHVITAKLYPDLGILPDRIPAIEDSWKRRDRAILGRIDLAFDGANPPKLLEYHSDSLSLLIETAFHQREWLLQTEGDNPVDQATKLLDLLPNEFNSSYTGRHIHFTCDTAHKEALSNTIFMREMANTGGCSTFDINIGEIGWDHSARNFVDTDQKPISVLHKNYPWEWMLKEDFGKHLLRVPPPNLCIEPAWKIILNSKGILAVLWKLFPNHPNLLPAGFNYLAVGREFVKKPLFGRDGFNIEIQSADRSEHTGGIRETESFLYQGLANLPQFDGHYSVISSFIVGDSPAGVGVKEDTHRITSKMACFVPHVIYAQTLQA